MPAHTSHDRPTSSTSTYSDPSRGATAHDVSASIAPISEAARTTSTTSAMHNTRLMGGGGRGEGGSAGEGGGSSREGGGVASDLAEARFVYSAAKLQPLHHGAAAVADPQLARLAGAREHARRVSLPWNGGRIASAATSSTNPRCCLPLLSCRLPFP